MKNLSMIVPFDAKAGLAHITTAYDMFCRYLLAHLLEWHLTTTSMEPGTLKKVLHLTKATH